MKLLNFRQNNEIKLGIKTKKGIIDVENEASSLKIICPKSMNEVIKKKEHALSQLTKLSNCARNFLNEATLEFTPCINNPEKIICVGLNYIAHGDEVKMELPKSPILFNKYNNALAAHNQKISISKEVKKLDYEAEMIIVIGEKISKATPETAKKAIFGYTIGNDLSDRDLQFRTQQWMIGKTLDNFAPIGPYIATKDSIDADNLNISTKVNGEIRQKSNTKNMIFSCEDLICYISKYVTLQPGDIIFTGTPSGVILGNSDKQAEWLKTGDTVEIQIEGIGKLTNYFN